MRDYDLVIYHGGCSDGWCSAWVAQRARPEAQLLPARYGDPPPDVAGRRVLVVDFSYPRATLEQMRADAADLLVLDHHASAQRDLAGLPYAIFDQTRSGAGLTWAHLHPDEVAPWLVRYVEDRDLWRFLLPSSRAVGAYVGTLPHEREAWDPLYGPTVPEEVLERGAGALAAIEEYARRVAAHSERGRIGGLEIPVVCAAYPWRSEVLEILCRESPVSAGWHRESDGRYSYSLRSDGSVDVSILAARYGGGGHPGASGFRSDRLVHAE